ncbi:MAG: CBS domain-containing protein [Planctomycetes bacterium]|nr:CBS domain-containing protein [Planctomycetota bacterium]
MENKKNKSDSVNTSIVDIHSDRLITSSRVWLEVKDVMSKDVVTTSPNETAVSAAKTMSENNVSCAVVMDKGSIAGILTEKDLFKMIADKNKDFDKIKVAQVMSPSVDSIGPDLSVLDASGIMEGKRIRRLPILKDKQLIGIVTQSDLTRALTSYGMWKDVGEIMSSDIAAIQTKTTVAEAVKIMKTRNISCIIVLEGNKVQGIITERDLLKGIVALKKNPVHIKVEKVMSWPIITVPTSYSVFSARSTMEKMHVRRLVVMDGEELCGIVTQTDIFKAVKQKLQEEEEKNSLLLEHSENSIYTLDSDGRINYVNPAFMKLLEISGPAELINKPFLPEKFWVNSEDRTWCLRKLKKENVKIKELALKTSKGKIIYVTMFSTFTKNLYGHINGSQGIFYDITDRRLAEQSTADAYQKLKTANDELKQAQSRLVQNEKLASIGQLAAGVAHEMNTPVGFVASNFQTLNSYVKKIRDLVTMYDELIAQIETSEKSELRNKVEAIGQSRNDMKIDFILEDINGLFDDSREGLDRVTDIIQNLKDFSRIDQPGSRDEYDLNKGIEATLIVARNEIKYDADVKTDFSEVPLIFCHSGQINQVFLNILVNAAQAIKAQKRDGNGIITIKTYTTDDNEVVCEIVDDGPGIPPETLSKIFEPFFTTKPVGKGTGLGLSVSYDIITNKHKGTLLVDSTVGEGTKFTIKLPISTKENEEKEIAKNGKENSVICG